MGLPGEWEEEKGVETLILPDFDEADADEAEVAEADVAEVEVAAAVAPSLSLGAGTDLPLPDALLRS